MKITSLILALILLACCPDSNSLLITGDPAPFADVVLLVAQQHCDRPIVGELRWVAQPETIGLRGHCVWEGGGCPMDAWVLLERVTPGGDPLYAWETAEAHEIGHWCLRINTDGLSPAEHDAGETRVEAWATVVNDEARSHQFPAK